MGAFLRLAGIKPYPEGKTHHGATLAALRAYRATAVITGYATRRYAGGGAMRWARMESKLKTKGPEVRGLKLEREVPPHRSDSWPTEPAHNYFWLPCWLSDWCI